MEQYVGSKGSCGETLEVVSDAGVALNLVLSSSNQLTKQQLGVGDGARATGMEKEEATERVNKGGSSGDPQAVRSQPLVAVEGRGGGAEGAGGNDGCRSSRIVGGFDGESRRRWRRLGVKWCLL